MRIYNKPVSLITLNRKKRKWQKIVGLDKWFITIDYATKYIIGDNVVGMATDCNTEARKANIHILDTYYLTSNNGTVYNLDTIIIHELLHIFMWEMVEKINPKIRKRKDFKNLEEFLCDEFADIVFNNLTKKM